jgi:hypothetical protein
MIQNKSNLYNNIIYPELFIKNADEYKEFFLEKEFIRISSNIRITS